MYIRSLPVEIEMMPIQQDSRKKDLQVDLKNAKEMKELYQVRENTRKQAESGLCAEKKEAPPQSSKDDGGAILLFIFL
ncbi:hypothetical protein [Bacteroides finegoldii]|uniref:hypothetical protein n=1 Tax=Bacteroides finegoldii TaxID=338188 RepID=UPI00189AC819|nr:hypothetical protein [Bacteroides finegoldii]